MSNPRRSKPVVSRLGALTPESTFPAVTTSTKPEDLATAEWWRRLVYLERKRNGQVETILTKHITTLENQVSDLRALYMASITLRPSATEPGVIESKGKQ